MKLAFSTLACPDWSWEQVIERAKIYGYDGIEWRLIDGETVSASFPEERCREIETAVSEAGLETCALDSSVSLAHPPGAERDKQLGEAVRLLELAQALGTDALRVFPGKYPESVSDEEAKDWVSAGLEHLTPHARETGVKIALEIHDSFDWNRREKRGTTTSSLTKDVLSRAGTPEVGLLWDLSNPYFEGEEAAETWDNVKHRLLYVHLKDMKPKVDGDWQYVPMGEGELPLREVVNWLEQAGYDGWLSFEWEKKWHPDLAEPEEALPQFLSYLRPLLKNR